MENIKFRAGDKKKKETVDMPCLECGEIKKVDIDSNEATGVFNVFCNAPGKDCEDRYAWKQ